MGGSSRYDNERPPLNADIAAEARAYSIIAELLANYRDEAIGDREVAMNISNLLHSAAIELNNGRAIPIGIRRAVRGLANALRESMDPNTRTS
jgi:DNA gyrase/topoisomerase IV subunit B